MDNNPEKKKNPRTRILWSDRETNNMLCIILEMNLVSKLDSTRQRNEATYRELEVQLKALDPLWRKTWIQIRTKWKSLKKAYHAEHRRRNKSGESSLPAEDDTGTDEPAFKHYDKMYEVMQHRPLSNIHGLDSLDSESGGQNLIDTIEEYEGRNSHAADENQDPSDDGSSLNHDDSYCNKNGKRSYDAAFSNHTQKQVAAMEKLQLQHQQFTEAMLNKQAEREREVMKEMSQGFQNSLNAATATLLTGLQQIFTNTAVLQPPPPPPPAPLDYYYNMRYYRQPNPEKPGYPDDKLD